MYTCDEPLRKLKKSLRVKFSLRNFCYNKLADKKRIFNYIRDLEWRTIFTQQPLHVINGGWSLGNAV